MSIHVANRRSNAETIRKKCDDPVMIDVTSHGIEPWVRFSPFYPHSDISVPSHLVRSAQVWWEYGKP